MALDFNNKIPEWKNKGIEPTDELKEKGFTGGYKPPATVFNWFWSLVQKCISELQTIVKSHANNTDNPHGVTKAQVGLGNVDDTADKDKNVLSASKLTNTVKLNGITFDGTKDIEIPATPKRTGLASDADLNEITAQGEYFASYGNTCINKPNNVKGFALKVYWNIVGSTSAITQVLYPSIGAIPMCFIRKGNSNGWADWQEVSTVGHTHTQSDITDFNKPTPLKLLEDATEIDLNNIKTTGIYTSVTQTKYLNCPTTLVTDSGGKHNYAFSLIVLGSRVYGTKDTISYYTQICIDNFGGQGQNQIWIRTYYGNSGWTAWYTFYSSKNKPTIEDIVGNGGIAVSKGGTGRSSLNEGYAIVGNGTKPVNLRYIRSDIMQSSNDLVTSSAVYNSLATKANKENLSELEESLSATDSSVIDLSNMVANLNKCCYLVGASDSDENLAMYCDVVCKGVKDDVAIQKLIDEIPAGSEIKFLSGNYNLENYLKIDKPLSIIGSGLNTVFTATYVLNGNLSCTTIFYVNSQNEDVIEGVKISNLKISRGLCKLNGKFVSGTGITYESEYPVYTAEPKALLLAGNVIKLMLDTVQFENKLTGSTAAIRTSVNSVKTMTVYLRDCFHTNNRLFNGYFIDTVAGNVSYDNLTLALNGCDSTGSLDINLPTKESKNNVLDNSFNVKYYIKGAEE